MPVPTSGRRINASITGPLSTSRAMAVAQTVLPWIESLPDGFEDIPVLPARKRKAPQEPSPPATMETTPTRKRQRQQGPDLQLELDNSDLTPRVSATSSRSRRSSRRSSASTSISGTHSRSSSPLKKQLLGMRLDDAGLELRELEVEAAPNTQAAALLTVLHGVGRGLRVLPEDERDRIFNSPALQGINTALWMYSFKLPEETDTLPGRIPLPEEIALMRELARECHVSKHEEASWNGEVHRRLLEAVFRKPGCAKGDLFNFAASTTARPHIKWVPRSAGLKMVDFCIYADFDKNDEAMQAQLALCRHTPTLSVNHTDFPPLQLRPIVLSIETKKPGKEQDAAELQIGVWHASQWSFLHSAIVSSLQYKASADEEPAPGGYGQQADQALSRLPFLPGIIILGHQWYFVLSTREKGKTILWTKRLFGSTESIMEVYQIVAGLRELAAWARDTYLPWFQECILSGFNTIDDGL